MHDWVVMPAQSRNLYYTSTIREPLISSMNGTDAFKMINDFVAYTDAGKGRELDCMDAGGRADAVAEGAVNFALSVNNQSLLKQFSLNGYNRLFS